MLPLRLRALWLTFGALGVGLAFLLSLWPHGAPGLESIPDKIQHAVGYAIVVVWFVGLVHPRHYRWVFLGAVGCRGSNGASAFPPTATPESVEFAYDRYSLPTACGSHAPHGR